MYVVKRKALPPSGGFNLGRWEIPVIVVAMVWLVFELPLFRDASFVDPWTYVMYACPGRRVPGVPPGHPRWGKGLAMPDMHSIDAELNADAAKGADAAGRRTEARAVTTVLAIDQGTSGTKAIVVDADGGARRSPRSPVRPSYLPGGGVEQDPRRCSTPCSTPAARPSPQAGAPVDAVAAGQPGRDRPGLGPRHRRAAHPGRRVAGPPGRGHLRRRWPASRGHGRAAHRAGPRPVLLRAEDGVDPRATSPPTGSSPPPTPGSSTG